MAERATADSRVTTRFAGVIGPRFVSRGEFVQPGQKLFELVQDKHESLTEESKLGLCVGLAVGEASKGTFGPVERRRSSVSSAVRRPCRPGSSERRATWMS